MTTKAVLCLICVKYFTINVPISAILILFLLFFLNNLSNCMRIISTLECLHSAKTLCCPSFVWKHVYKQQICANNLTSCHHLRRGGQWLTCRTHASLHGYGNVSVSVSIDKAKLQKDLQFEYVEDPTITKIEPEWSIFRYTEKRHIFLIIASSVRQTIALGVVDAKTVKTEFKAQNVVYNYWVSL